MNVSPPPRPLRRKPETRYNIRDAAGTLVAVHRRVDGPEGKVMPWYQPDGVTEGLDGVHAGSLPLYGSDEVAYWPLSETIVVTEGEKAMEALCQVGVAVLGTYGVSATPSVDAVRPVAVGRTFVLWPDHDEPGRAHMAKVAQVLYQAGATKVYIIDTTTQDWTKKGYDAADFVPPIPSPATWVDIDPHTERVMALIAKYAKPVSRESKPKAKPALRIVVRGETNTQHGLDAQTLSGRLDKVRPTSDGGYMARCPAHEDRIASLTFRDGDDGRLLVYCHAGCTFEQVMGALA